MDANAFITLKQNEFENTFCTYEHWLRDPVDNTFKIKYVGCCKLREVFVYPDARRNNEWQRIFTKDAILTVRIVFTSSNLVDCQNQMAEIYKRERPHCNVRGYKMTSRTVVTCNETGETFNSILEAARAKGLSQSQLNNHINNRVGHKTVKGLTFRRGIEGEQ